jgi:uncharacterized protein YkvS
MPLDYRQFTKDLNKIDLQDICSDWQWLLNNEYSPIMVSLSGDMFLSKVDGVISWLDTGTGQLEKIAENSAEFLLALTDLDNIDKWLLASTVLDLIESGLILKETEVYSYKIMPIMNGDYSIKNFDAMDISVHFSMTGQICRQLQNVPNGTKINKVTIAPPNFLDYIKKG